jgi:energy-coupling factor transporter ATP-binding protein EcfA2
LVLQVGLVFQFPERHFLGEDVLQELTFAWPRTYPERQQLSMRLPQVRRPPSLHTH